MSENVQSASMPVAVFTASGMRRRRFSAALPVRPAVDICAWTNPVPSAPKPLSTLPATVTYSLS